MKYIYIYINLNNKYCTQHMNVLVDISGLLNCGLFFSPPPLLFFRKCISSLCKTHPQASPTQILNDEHLTIFCKTYNMIHRINYKICGLNFIGETNLPLYLMINQHRSNSENYNTKTNY